MLLWSLGQPERLTALATARLLDSQSLLRVSIASLWEIAIKLSIGKLELADDWLAQIEQRCREMDIAWIAVQTRHCAQLPKLPYHHKDPFDRMLIAQAQIEGLALISADNAFDAYGVERIW